MRVPNYDNFQTAPSVGQGPAYQAPNGPSGAQVGAEQMQAAGGAATRTGNAVSRIALAMQDQANQTRISDAMNQAIGARLKWTHDKEVGYASLAGFDALNRPDGKALDAEYGEKLGKDLTAIRDNLGNDDQKRVFGMQADQLLTQFTGQVTQHMVGAQKAYHLSTQVGTVKVAADQMALDWQNPEALAQGQNAIKASIAEIGRVQGLSPVETTAKMVEALSPAHATVISTAIQAGNIDYAKTYADQVNAELTPDARLRLGEALKIGDTRAKAQTFGDEVISKGLGMAEALTEARARFQGKDEDEAVREVKERYTEQEVARSRDVKQVGTAAWSAVMQTGKIPPTLLADLRTKAPEEERQIRDWLEAKWRRAKADAEGKAETDMDVYYGLRRMAMDDPAQFGGLDLRKSQPYLKDGDLKHLIEIQGSISKGDANAMESQRVVKQTLGVIRAEVAAIGIDLTPKEGTQQAQETAKFMGALTQALDAATSAKGAPLTADESKRIGMSMVQEGVKQGSGVFGLFQTRQRGYQIATDPNAAPGDSYVVKRFGDIPPAVRDALTAEYRTRKGLGTRPLTIDQEAEIERAYTRGVQTGRIK